MLVHGLPRDCLAGFCALSTRHAGDSPFLKFGTAPILGPQRSTLAGMQNFLSPRKSWIAVAVVCALSAAALLAGPAPAPTADVADDDPMQLQANPILVSPAPNRK
jgi:hypothetical protein